MRVSTGADVSSTSSIEQSAMYSGRGRGRGRDFGGHSLTGGRRSALDKGLKHCKHYGRSSHIAEKCWEKFGQL